MNRKWWWVLVVAMLALAAMVEWAPSPTIYHVVETPTTIPQYVKIPTSRP